MEIPGRPVLKQFATYLVVGGMGTGVHYLILLTLVRKLQFPPVTASAIGFTGGAVVNYFLNYFWTFRSSGNHSTTFVRFFLVALIGLGLNTGLMSVFTLALAVHYLVAQVAATGLVTGITFLGNRHWTFLEVSHDGVE